MVRCEVDWAVDFFKRCFFSLFFKSSKLALPSNYLETNNEANGKEYLVRVLESDVEAANRKSQWITEREMERELLQVCSVEKGTK